MTDGELLHDDIFRVLNCYEIDASEISDGKTYIDSTEAEKLTAEIMHLIKQNTLSKESVSGTKFVDGHDSSIPDDAGELREKLEKLEVAVRLNDDKAAIGRYGYLHSISVDALLRLIHQQRKRWEARALENVRDEIMSSITFGGPRGAEACVEVIGAHIDKLKKASLAAAEGKEEI